MPASIIGHKCLEGRREATMFENLCNILPSGTETYIVGGAVRDTLLGRSPNDIDIVVARNARDFAQDLNTSISGHLFTLGKPGLNTHRIVTGHRTYDITPLNGSSIAEDLARRDFTVNAMAYSLSEGELIDPLDGMRDMKKRQVRMASSESFRRDPVRLIRAFRMGADLRFSIEKGTAEAIHRDGSLISTSAGERIQTELFHILAQSNSYPYISLMADLELLLHIFPEMLALKGCRQGRHHQFDAFEHTLRAYQQLEMLLNAPHRQFPLTDRGGSLPYDDTELKQLLKFSILLHDIGKPDVRTEENGGHIAFIGHETRSAELAADITGRMKFSKNRAAFVEKIIYNHLKPLHLFNSHRRGELTVRGRIRFFRALGEHTPYLLMHTVADILGKHNDDARNTAFIQFARTLAHQFIEDYKTRALCPPLITGRDLIEQFQLTPSPRFKELLDAVENERLAGNLATRLQAIEFIKNYLNTD